MQGGVAWSNGYHHWLPFWRSLVQIPLEEKFFARHFDQFVLFQGDSRGYFHISDLNRDSTSTSMRKMK